MAKFFDESGFPGKPEGSACNCGISSETRGLKSFQDGLQVRGVAFGGMLLARVHRSRLKPVCPLKAVMPATHADNILAHTSAAYGRNGKLILFFSVPFLVAVPLLSLLPNFSTLGGIFLRFGSVPATLSLVEFGFIAAIFLVSLLLASFAIAAVNVVIRSQRTLNLMSHYEASRIEHATFRLFFVLLAATLVILASNLLLLDLHVNFGGKVVALQPLLGSLVSFVVSAAILFVPQAIAVDDAGVPQALRKSVKFVFQKPAYFVLFLVAGSVLLLLNDALFLTVMPGSARMASLLVTAFLIVPLLEVVKTQIYLSKYTLI